MDGSATDDAQFTFQSYDDTTRTLTWTAATVSEDGSVSYQATVDEGASELPQPLINVATIDSDEAEPDEDDSDVYVPTVPLAATATPRIALPADRRAPGCAEHEQPGLADAHPARAGAVVLVIGFITPVPASVGNGTAASPTGHGVVACGRHP